MAEEETTSARVYNRASGQLQPIVIDYKKRKKNKERRDQSKPRYSNGLKDAQRLEGDLMRVAQRATTALSDGIDTYEKERKKSARKKKDGAVKDYLNNSAKAFSASIKEASEIPVDLAEIANKSSYRKRLRSNLRKASRLIRLFPL